MTMTGIPDAITELLKLLNKVFGYVTDPTGWAQLTRDNQLKLIMRGCNESIAKNDWPTYDGLMGNYRELRQQST
jgi:hypothetical protein